MGDTPVVPTSTAKTGTSEEDADTVALPDSYKQHHPPTALPAPTQQTVEMETVKINEDEGEERRRDTVRLRRSQSSNGSANAPVQLVPEDEITEPDQHSLEIELALRRITARSRYFTLLVAGLGIVTLIAVTLIVRLAFKGPDEPLPQAAPVATTAPPATAALLPGPPKAEPKPEPEPATTTKPPPAPVAKSEPAKVSAIRSKEPKSAPAATAPAKASFPIDGKSSAPAAGGDIRRDVPF